MVDAGHRQHVRDIITDLGAMTQADGIAAGGNINPNGVSMFEPMAVGPQVHRQAINCWRPSARCR